MFNRTLRRPMFRRGGSTGSAGTGILSGLQSPRQGYATNEDNLVLQDDPTKLENPTDMQKVGTNMSQFDKAFPSYNSAGSDFFLNLGSNILAAPGGNPILQTLGTAAREPLLQMQKTNMANTQGQRELALKFWQSMDDDDKDQMIKRAEAMVEKDPERFPGGVKDALAVLIPTYRKDQSPQETEREKILSDEDTTADSVSSIEKTYSLGKPDAVKLQQFQKDIINDMSAAEGEKKYKLPYDGSQYFIESEDLGERSSKDSRLIFKDIKSMDDYKDGFIYLDLENNKAYVKQGQFFIPYSEWAAEEISTD
jgi:hypothetical protein